MALVLKSDVAASKFISDSAGIKVAGYSVSADFVNRNYIIDNEKVDFADIINYSRPSPSFKIIDGVLTQQPVNTVIFDDPDGIEKGLFFSRTDVSLAGSGQVKTSGTRNLASGFDKIHAVLQVFGSGSVAVSGDVEILSDSNVASKGNPVNVRLNKRAESSTIDVTFTVSGNVDHYQLQRWSYTTAVQPLNHTDTSGSSINLSQQALNKVKELNEYTIAIRVRNTAVFNPYGSQPHGLMELKTNNTTISYFMNGAGNSSLRMLDAGGKETYLTPDVAKNNDDVLVLVYGKGYVNIYRNGSFYGFKENVEGDEIESLTVGSTPQFSSASFSGTGLIKNIAVYPRALGNDEALELSSSFLP